MNARIKIFKHLKNTSLITLLIMLLCLTSSCGSDDFGFIDFGPEFEDLVVKTGIIEEDETWNPETVYLLDGKVVVNEGVTLTILPGTIIKGDQGQGTRASALIVDQGGVLIANGTANNPIIFTSVLDNIEAGQTAGTNLTIDDTGLWGGIIVLGRAPISTFGDIQTAQIEGIPADEPYGQYGGTIANDNSGSLQYISIRHGGITIGQDNEINGLTLAGVGSGTTINHIEIVANQDDGIEWFGGTVNSSNLLTWGHGDDGIDVDQAYAGTISNALVIQTPTSGSAFELDGPEGSAATEASFTINNATLIGNGSDSFIADLRDGALTSLNNVLVSGFGANAKVRINGADSQTEFANGRITFSNWQVVLPAGVTVPGLLTGATAGTEGLFTSNVTAVTSTEAATVGADTEGFGWTFTALQGAF